MPTQHKILRKSRKAALCDIDDIIAEMTIHLNFSKVSSRLHRLYKVTIDLTFENFE